MVNNTEKLHDTWWSLHDQWPIWFSIFVTNPLFLHLFQSSLISCMPLKIVLLAHTGTRHRCWPLVYGGNVLYFHNLGHQKSLPPICNSNLCGLVKSILGIVVKYSRCRWSRLMEKKSTFHCVALIPRMQLTWQTDGMWQWKWMRRWLGSICWAVVL